MFADKVASPHDIDPAGRNALVHASKHKSTELAVSPLDQGADVSQPDSLGGTASERFLQRSFGGMYSDNDAIIRCVLKSDDSFDDFGFMTLHKIVLGFDIRELQAVLDATTDTLNVPDSLDRTCLSGPFFWTMLSMFDYCSRMVQIRMRETCEALAHWISYVASAFVSCFLLMTPK